MVTSSRPPGFLEQCGNFKLSLFHTFFLPFLFINKQVLKILHYGFLLCFPPACINVVYVIRVPAKKRLIIIARLIIT